MKDENKYLLECYEAAFDEKMPPPLRDFILTGDFIKSSSTLFTDPVTSETFKISFSKDVAYRMDNLFDQHIRLTIEEKLNIDTPIAFADLEIIPKSKAFSYCLVIFSTKTKNKSSPVFMLKYKGMDKNMKCELYSIAESFEEFISTITKKYIL